MSKLEYILSEMALITLSFGVSVQSSSLWASLLTIPTSIVLIMVFSSDKSSGLLLLLFIMIFIGGLLVLLMGVASSIHQEQAIVISLFYFILIVLMMIPILVKTYSVEWSTFYSSLFSWVFSMSMAYFSVNIIMIVLGLLVISSLLMEFKGMIRKL